MTESIEDNKFRKYENASISMVIRKAGVGAAIKINLRDGTAELHTRPGCFLTYTSDAKVERVNPNKGDSFVDQRLVKCKNGKQPIALYLTPEIGRAHV